MNHGAHMVVVSKGYAVLFGDFAEPVKSCAELIPLFVVHNVFAVEHGGVHLPLNAVALFAHAHSFCAYGF